MNSNEICGNHVNDENCLAIQLSISMNKYSFYDIVLASLHHLFWTFFAPFYSVSIVDFAQLNVCWIIPFQRFQKKKECKNVLLYWDSGNDANVMFPTQLPPKAFTKKFRTNKYEKNKTWIATIKLFHKQNILFLMSQHWYW